MTPSQHHILTALELRIQNLNDSFNSIEQKLYLNINLSGLVVAIIGVLGFSTLTQSILLKTLLFCVLVGSGGTIFWSLRALQLRDWKDIDVAIISFAESESRIYFDTVSKDYQDIIKNNSGVLKEKQKLFRCAVRCVQLQLVIIFIFAVYMILCN